MPSIDLNNIPEELRELDQWVAWKTLKYPLNALTGKHASTSDPSTWCSFKEACEAIEEGIALGVGFVFTDDDPYTAIDLDKVITDDDMSDQADSIIKQMDSYTEISRSGHGIHIIVRGDKNTAACRKGQVEVYETKRYFALTGNIYGGHEEIEDRQAELDTLCDNYLTPSAGSSDIEIIVGDLELDPDADPPVKLLNALLKKKGVRQIWEHRHPDLDSLSDYDWSLANIAMEEDWSDQEIADLIIAFRRAHGDKNDIKKSLRLDYITLTIQKVRGASSGFLALLDFKVTKLIQYGFEDAEWVIVLESGQRINMGSTEAFLSPRRAEARLYEADIVLSKKARGKWREIAHEMRLTKEKVSTVTRDESAQDLISDYIKTRTSIPIIEPEEKDIFQTADNISADKEGRLYLRLKNIASFAKTRLNWGASNKSIAKDLASMGFVKHKQSLMEEGKRTQVSVWISPKGFYDLGEEDEDD